ncbi:MAG: LacI family DNA-binding transcriptional regulator [Solobacterium sp.]|nr:LacI family DNA-binding transcriptional regulator [Solobacterium sp.]
MSNKVTIQDIADALHLSRNTVSKAINNSNGIAESTRELVLQKAVEMGYKQFSYVQSLTSSPSLHLDLNLSNDCPKEIALFTSVSLNTSHFASLMLDKIISDLQTLGLNLVTYRIFDENIQNLQLPLTFNQKNVCAILCIELFDYEYSKMICDMGLPVLFVDCPPLIQGRTLNADILLMDNQTGIAQAINDCVKQGYTSFGFIGDYMHCQSFYERYRSFNIALLENHIALDEKYIINYKDGTLDSMVHQLQSLDQYPEVFICANDFVAIDAMLVLRNGNVNIPNDVKFLGFDDSQESRIFQPTLSTIHIHTQSMAYEALQLLTSRMMEPKIEPRYVYVATDLIYRNSLSMMNKEE